MNVDSARIGTCSKCKAPTLQADPRIQVLCDNCRRLRLTPSERIRVPSFDNPPEKI